MSVQETKNIEVQAPVYLVYKKAAMWQIAQNPNNPSRPTL